MRELRGRGAARGCVKGVVSRYQIGTLSYDRHEAEDYEAEFLKLQDAKDSYAKALADLMARENNPADAVLILEAHQDIMEDDTFFDAVLDRVKNEHCNIEYAIKQEQESVAEQFAGLDDEYLKERIADIENVCNELIRRIQGVADSKLENTGDGKDKIIVFAEDLTPEQTLEFDHSIIGGFVTEKGGLTSHTVILAKTLGIPAIVGAAGALEEASNGEDVIIYGDTGEVYLDPDDETIRIFKERESESHILDAAYSEALTKEAVTLDGVKIDVCINIADWESEDELAPLSTSDGVGLYRTEFIYIHSKDYPSEDKQFEYYSTVAKLAEGKEVIIRTLDIGGDKQASYMNLPKEENPFLGYRAIRLCLSEEEIFETQLRAILRASAHGKVSIMFPMIASVEELLDAKKHLENAKKDLRRRGIGFDEDINVGIMVETPAAVQLSDSLAKHCDFFSIGTNDLIQYTVAADRMNEKLQYLQTPKSLAVLRSVNIVAENAAKYGTRVNMCGEAASDESLVPLWVAMGLTELSVVPGQVAQTKYTVNHINKAEIRAKLGDILSLDTIVEVEEALDELKKHYGI